MAGFSPSLTGIFSISRLYPKHIPSYPDISRHIPTYPATSHHVPLRLALQRPAAIRCSAYRHRAHRRHTTRRDALHACELCPMHTRSLDSARQANVAQSSSVACSHAKHSGEPSANACGKCRVVMDASRSGSCIPIISHCISSYLDISRHIPTYPDVDIAKNAGQTRDLKGGHVFAPPPRGGPPELNPAWTFDIYRKWLRTTKDLAVVAASQRTSVLHSEDHLLAVQNSKLGSAGKHSRIV